MHWIIWIIVNCGTSFFSHCKKWHQKIFKNIREDKFSILYIYIYIYIYIYKTKAWIFIIVLAGIIVLGEKNIWLLIVLAGIIVFGEDNVQF